jgi:hypothetical protein
LYLFMIASSSSVGRSVRPNDRNHRPTGDEAGSCCSGALRGWPLAAQGHYRTSVFLESNALSEHSGRAQDDRLWNGQSQRFGRLHVDDELELGGLLEREIIEVRPLKNLVHL